MNSSRHEQQLQFTVFVEFVLVLMKRLKSLISKKGPTEISGLALLGFILFYFFLNLKGLV